MKTNEFISELRRAPENQLLFVDGKGHAVHAGYHLTELKAASLDTVDCGGQANQWQETIVQLWVMKDRSTRQGQIDYVRHAVAAGGVCRHQGCRSRRYGDNGRNGARSH